MGIRSMRSRTTSGAGLALVNGKVYVSEASHCDNGAYQGWVFGYAASDLTVAPDVFTPAAHAPTGVESGIWMSGGAPASDSANNVYLITGNGTFDVTSTTGPPHDDYGDSILKLSTSTGISVVDYFAPANFGSLQSGDTDLGSGGAAVLVDQPGGPVPHLLIGGGKSQILYLLNRDNLGQETTATPYRSRSYRRSRNFCHASILEQSTLHRGSLWNDNAASVHV